MTKIALALVAAAVTTATVTAVTATPAAAQEREPFTGPRVEANIGYDNVHSRGVPAELATVDGLRLGAAAGYDLALAPKVRAGVEAGVGFSVADTTRATFATTAGSDRFRLSNGRDIDLSLRLGYLVGPKTMLYAKAGWANSEARVRLDRKVGATVTTVRDHDVENGVRFGGGVEQMLGGHAYAKAEYRYTAYGEGVNRHQALVGFGYRF
jgi:outer membrane immunogenic protein